MTLGRVHMLEAVERLSGSRYRCLCDCGAERIVKIGHFNAGYAKSCGAKCPLRPAPPAAKPCVIPGCGKLECNDRGWCWTHYTRWRRHGDPHVTKTGQPEAFIRAHLDYQGDDCIIWPFGRSDTGYGGLVYEGERHNAHRLMCILAHGEAPSPDLQAAHWCGNRPCINPKHLRWATQAENEADKIRHGRYNHGTHGRQHHG